jgi:ABC-type lipoprotein export system ATPase subunit
MGLLNDILAWTKADLTDWQRDAARRLFLQETGLSDQDYDELYALLKAAHGLPNPQGLQPLPLDTAHMPTISAGATPAILLLAMRELRHVNRIAPNQKLIFSPSGITVIYGGNGSGKSGYARVLKRACRARDQMEEVLPDATVPIATDCIPEAIFDIRIGSTDKSVTWNADEVSPDELSTIAVFDAHCARIYLTAEQDVAYLPYGLDVVEDLANKVLPELSKRLEREIGSLSIDVQPLRHLWGETTVGKLITTLSANTNVELVKALGTLTQEQTERIKALDEALSLADPRSKARDLRLSVGRLKGLGDRLNTPLSWVDDRAMARLKAMDEAAAAATEAEIVAAELFRSGETLLPGTGEPVWKALFDAARKFSVELAYPGHAFPNIEGNALCPLCQQPIGTATERLKRFDRFVRQDATRVAEEKRQQIETALRKIESAELSVGLEKALTEELDSLDQTLSGKIRAFEASLNVRRGWMLSAAKSHTWDVLPEIHENPRQRLRDLAARQLRSARTLEKAADETKSKALKHERDELRARQALATSIDAVLSLIERMKHRQAFEACKKDLKTKSISDKSREFASNAVTGALRKALEEEFEALGVGHIKTELKERNSKGKIMYRLVLDLPSGHKLESILSEGEQRAIALGSFLAELRLSKHTGGIVFDDPVSSLDYHRRQNVARRLVQEAKHRQVIVLTHDTSFLGELLDAIDQAGVNHIVQYLEWVGDRPGYVSEGLPWGHMPYKQRIDHLEKAQKTLEKKVVSPYPNESESTEIRREYGRLRATIERVIQDVVFCGVVRRYRDWIRVDQLEEVVGFADSEYKEIARLHKRCCDFVDAHDPSSAKNAPVPTPQQLGKDLDDLKAIVAAILARRKAAKASQGVTPSV